ncbi:SDR family oxidoreductase [Leptospira langatensis]|uniref:SDR family oxidoreductase n=1 Tax=Leptospira langatensis TaxID=2484983 RepID=A0A5F1ZRT0_9LEPT|nr:SDR family oxidoreductase [Leptospira langatensis]TGK01843.1 SDR family oxidoreductase [Leptospira langatensis]TGL39448.1 SDR family oxidoreductase [Leptospira langatensis]
MKRAVITGGTEGIGKATVQGLAERGWAITLVARNKDKAENTVREISAKTGNKNLEYILGDLSSLAEVKRIAQELSQKHSSIDCLINNAGVMSPERKETKDGHELNFGVNHLSHVLLTRMLLTNIKKSPQGRIVIVSSKLHRNAKPDLDDLEQKSKYDWMKAYSDSKLFNVYFAQDLSELLQDTSVTANALHPGVVNTELVRDLRGPVGFLFGLVKNLIFISPTKGAQTSIYLADAPGLEKTSGQYFEDREKVRLKGLALDPDLRAKIREKTDQILKPFLN